MNLMPTYEMMSGPQAMMRLEPHVNAEVETELLAGEILTVTGRLGDWYQVEKDFGGIIYAGYVPCGDLADVLYQPTHMVARLSSPILSFPGLKGVVRGHITLGGLVKVIDERDNHVRVFPYGWLYKRDIVSLTDTRPDYVDVLQTLLGVSFVWGGRSAFGVDCSGMAHLALTVAGIDAPRRLKHMTTSFGTVLPASEPPRRAGPFSSAVAAWA